MCRDHYESDDVDNVKSADAIYHLMALGAMVRMRDDASEQIEELVNLARADGCSWADIGERLGVARETAMRVYGEGRDERLEARRRDGAVRRNVVRAAGLATR